MSPPSPRPAKSNGAQLAERPESQSVIRRSWHQMSSLLQPFSSTALAKLPNPSRPQRYQRADGIPDAPLVDGERPTVRDYHTINSVPTAVRVPKKLATPVRVEGKVWFANERTWISWLNISILLGTFSLALFNASKDTIAKNFAYIYALISIGILLYGYAIYQHRITMIRRRDPGHFDFIAGPVIVSVLLFAAILANFIIRVREMKRQNIPIPGEGLWLQTAGTLVKRAVPGWNITVV